VLDNAAGTAQVLPLLPGTDTCAVVVTSRRSLAALGTHHPTRNHTLGRLSTQASFDLLARVIGDRRVVEDYASAAELAELCDGFPLALRICAARLATSATLTPAELAGEVRQERRRLTALAVEDDARNVRGAFSSAYRRLDPELRRTFRRVGMHPAGDFTTAAIAAMSGVPQERAETELQLLSAHHLLHPTAENRYTMHDLIALFARERAEAEDSDQNIAEMIGRLADWQLAVAVALNDAVSPANRALTPDTVPTVPLPFAPAGASPSRRDAARDSAMRFIDDELDNLATIMRSLDAHGHHTATAQIAYLLAGTLDRSRPAQALAITRAGLQAARATKDLAAQRVLHAVYVAHCLNLHRPDEALEHAAKAVEIVERLPSAQANAKASTYNMLGRAHLQLRNFAEAVESYERAISHYRQAENGPGLTMVLNNASVTYTLLGRLDRALAVLTEAVEVSTATGDPRTGAYANTSLGALYTRLGDPDAGLGRLRLGCDLARAVNDHGQEIWALTSLGDALTARSEHQQALRVLEEALRLAEKITNQDGEASARLRLGTVHLLRGELATAEDQLGRALELWTDAYDPLGQARLHHSLAVLADRRGAHRAAEHHRGLATRLFSGLHAHAEAERAERGDPPRY
jgi:tetratricopeptide (TPR) repeat protein